MQGQGTLSAEITAEVIDELAGQLERQEQESEERKRDFDRLHRFLVGPGPDVVFQPIFDLSKLEVVGVEALARFTADREASPERWFSAADRLGLLTELEVAAIRPAVARIDDVPAGAYLTVNVSPGTTSSPEFLDVIEPVMDRLVIEVTEHLPVDDYDLLNESLRDFRARGGRLAVDDAGAGFSSLRHILRLAPDFIKLDGALTRGIDKDRIRRALGSALISFASEINVPIIAEGIETQEEVDALRALDVNCGQGFFLAPPGPLPLAG
jgi:EAL domain-containing protein (putative c-di-GMP-specific phosphodiesterase class I)